MRNLILRKLSDLSINKQKLIYIITNSAPNMIKVGQLLKIINIRCLCHMIHTVLCKYMQKQKYKQIKISYDPFNVSQSDDEQRYQDSQQENYRHQQSKEQPLLNLIQRIRKLSRKIGVSGLFKDKVQQKGMHKANLIIDTSIRWSSMLKMIDKFLQKYTILEPHLKKEDKFSIEQLKDIQQFSCLLRQFEIAQLKIQIQQASIIDAQKNIAALAFTLQKHESLHGEQLLKLLIQHYNQYRIDKLLEIKASYRHNKNEGYLSAYCCQIQGQLIFSNIQEISR